MIELGSHMMTDSKLTKVSGVVMDDLNSRPIRGDSSVTDASTL